MKYKTRNQSSRSESFQRLETSCHPTARQLNFRLSSIRRIWMTTKKDRFLPNPSFPILLVPVFSYKILQRCIFISYKQLILYIYIQWVIDIPLQA